MGVAALALACLASVAVGVAALALARFASVARVVALESPPLAFGLGTHVLG